MRNIKEKLDEQRDDIHSALREVSHKVILYMGHQHRCQQEQRIARLFQELNGDRTTAKAVILLDNKMKFKAIRYREKTTECFGKKGMSWNGAVIFYEESYAKNNGDPQINDDKAIGGTVDLSTLFFDHLISNDTTQDCVVVCSILDAILARLRVELSSVTNIYLLSDNARCYQNDLLPIMAPFIPKKHRLKLKGFVHSETQRRKSLVDAHFALAMMHVNRYCNITRKDLTTPAEVVEALNSFNIVANCSAKVLHIRRDFPNMKQWSDAHKSGKLTKLGRINEFCYASSGEDEFTIKCYALSGGFFTEGKAKLHCSSRTGSSLQANLQDDIYSSDEDCFAPNALIEGSHIINTDMDGINDQIAYQSKMTGVTMRGRARLRKNQKRRRQKSRQLLDEGETALKEETEKFDKSASSEGENQSDQYQAKALLQCDQCHKVYRREDYFLKHYVNCSDAKTGQRVIDRACRMAMDLLGTPDAPIYTTKFNHPALGSLSIDNAVRESMKQSKG